MVHEQFKVAEVLVSYRPDYNINDRPRISSSNQTFQLLKSHWDMGKIGFLEEFKVLLLNRSNRVLGIVDISMGGVSGTFVDPKVVFATALKANCSSLILVHNHPSGSTRPSDTDIKLTKRLVECGKLLDIIVFDHIIISENCYYSFADDGMM
ncbi:JAB domain-containing protein [Pedobacter sp. MC2016-05]|uniref:JAB domain-containing protein n=1 Tax=Pedobacter sp. MC2016-05 TaxID=2994474 RepID=UPI0022481249|nr:JAB domain-containing protein [Pedobacter sp. MC2016-05]MCX2472771.1 JAB domain-containing protein [Pedobacter sp. MC2016-05]